MHKSAIFDASHSYRYSLRRTWDESKSAAVFIMLNPSTADDENDDPTIRRCIRFAQDWGYGELRVVNLFALISSNPKKLMTDWFPIDEGLGENDDSILNAIENAGVIIAAWGSFKESKERAAEVLDLLKGRALHCLGQNADGSPKHPLYITADTKPCVFRSEEHYE